MTYHFEPGDIVYFTPSNEAIAWAKGRRRVLRVLGEYVQLECGNILLMAGVAELKKIEMTRDYTEIFQRYKVRSLCDLANELERRRFPKPDKFEIGQTWYNTGGSRVEIIMFRKRISAEYYNGLGRKFQTKFLTGNPGAFATYLPTPNEIEKWEISNR